jgi:hypothetical protein
MNEEEKNYDVLFRCALVVLKSCHPRHMRRWGNKLFYNYMSSYALQVKDYSLFKCLYCGDPFKSMSSKTKHLKVHIQSCNY